MYYPLIRRFHEAEEQALPEVTVWGAKTLREFCIQMTLPKGLSIC